jgi:hypothetical protein
MGSKKNDSTAPRAEKHNRKSPTSDGLTAVEFAARFNAILDVLARTGCDPEPSTAGQLLVIDAALRAYRRLGGLPGAWRLIDALQSHVSQRAEAAGEDASDELACVEFHRQQRGAVPPTLVTEALVDRLLDITASVHAGAWTRCAASVAIIASRAYDGPLSDFELSVVMNAKDMADVLAAQVGTVAVDELAAMLDGLELPRTRKAG